MYLELSKLCRPTSNSVLNLTVAILHKARLKLVSLFKLHRSTTYVDAAYFTDWVSWSVGPFVGLSDCLS